jgi:hypothetical protein
MFPLLRVAALAFFFWWQMWRGKTTKLTMGRAVAIRSFPPSKATSATATMMSPPLPSPRPLSTRTKPATATRKSPHLQNKSHKTLKKKNMKQSSASDTIAIQPQPQQPQQKEDSSEDNDDPSSPPSSLATNDLILEIVSLTLGEAQAEEIVSTINTNNSAAQSSSSSKRLLASPLHCHFETSSSNNENNAVIFWASKCRAVALTPMAATLWTALAAHLVPLDREEQSDNNNDASFLCVAEMVAFLTNKHLPSSQGSSSLMSTVQAKPYLALAQLPQAVTVQLCKASTSSTVVLVQQQEEELKSKFMDTVSELLRRQVNMTTSSSSSSSSNMINMNSEGSWTVREECYSVICHLCRDTTTTTNNNKKIVSMETASLLLRNMNDCNLGPWQPWMPSSKHLPEST